MDQEEYHAQFTCTTYMHTRQLLISMVVLIVSDTVDCATTTPCTYVEQMNMELLLRPRSVTTIQSL